MGEQVKYFTLDGEYTAELPEANQPPIKRSESREMDKRTLAALLILVLMIMSFCFGLGTGLALG